MQSLRDIFQHGMLKKGMYMAGYYDYEEKIPCRPNKHDFAQNGCCWRCGHYREDLLKQAVDMLKTYGTVEEKETMQNVAFKPHRYRVHEISDV